MSFPEYVVAFLIALHLRDAIRWVAVRVPPSWRWLRYWRYRRARDQRIRKWHEEDAQREREMVP